VIRWQVRNAKNILNNKGYRSTATGQMPSGVPEPNPYIDASLVARKLNQICPTEAISAYTQDGYYKLQLDQGKCIACQACIRQYPEIFQKRPVKPKYARTDLVSTVGGDREAGVKVDSPSNIRRIVLPALKKSLHIKHIDAGSCNGCESELSLLLTSECDMTASGIFFTSSPAHADVLLVTGVVTERMRPVLLDAWQRMPEPKFLVALGACAISGGCFAAHSENIGLSNILPVSLFIAGCPASPTEILNSLRRLVEQ